MTLKKYLTIGTALAILALFMQTGSIATSASSDLAFGLPESDGVVSLDSKRLVTEAIPDLLSANPRMLEKFEVEIAKFKSETGLDLKRFDEVVVGLKAREKNSKSTEFDAVVLARGDVDTSSLEEVAKTVSQGKYRTETIAGRTVYVFSGSKMVDDKKPDQIRGSFFDGMFDKFFGGLSNELALTAIDTNTVALGSVERITATLDGSPRISSEVLSLLDRKPNALASMGMNVPRGMSQFLELEDDELGNNLDSITQIQGSLDILGGVTTLSVAARSSDAEKAENLAFTLKAIQGMFSGLLKNNKAPDKQVYGRMLDSLEVTHSGQQIFVDLSVPKSDIDVIIGKK